MRTKKTKAPRATNDWPKVDDAFKVYPSPEVKSFEVKSVKVEVVGKDPHEETQKFVETAFRYAARDIARQKGCPRGGKESGASRREDRKERNKKIIKRARELLETRSRRVTINTLSQIQWEESEDPLSPRQISNILKEKNL
jgi:hypothetical protein